MTSGIPLALLMVEEGAQRLRLVVVKSTVALGLSSLRLRGHQPFFDDALDLRKALSIAGFKPGDEVLLTLDEGGEK